MMKKMKKMKKLLALLAVFVLALSMAGTAFAKVGDEGNSNTNNEPGEKVTANLTGHEFKAYQIFSGTQTDETGSTGDRGDEENKLASIQWGDGINSKDFLTVLKDKNNSDFGSPNPFLNASTAADVANVMAAWENDGKYARAFAVLADVYKTGVGVAPGENMAAGYYLVVDETDFDADAANTVRNLAVLQMTKADTFQPEPKTDVPQMTKKVEEKNDSVASTGDSIEWQDTADYDIGDDISFILTGTLPTDYDNYETYKYVFHDTQSEGLSFNANSVKVYVDNKEIAPSNYSVVTTGIGTETFQVKFADLKQVLGVTYTSIITVEYTSTLTGDAVVIGGAGNSNEAYLEYSNNSNFGGSGETGRTPEDKVVVFTYSVTANKVDGDGEALEGAKFTLYKWKAATTKEEKDDWVKVKEIDQDTKFIFNGVDAGKYKLEETTPPNGYNKAEDIVFIVDATFDKDGNLTGLLVKDEAGNIISNSTGKDETNEKIIFAHDHIAGSVMTNVVNLRGSILPSTGGIGTTIFYVVGGVLIVGAVILLVVKKRMKHAA